jgi:SRSO17 transposase
MTTPLETAPAMELPPQAMVNLVEELRAYHAIYSPLFQRRAQREGAAKSLHGLLLEIPRQSVEPMVLALAGPHAKAVRTLQLCLSEGAWDDEVLRPRHWPEVDTLLGEDEGVLPLDGSALLQQGQASVGVNRQDCGEVGKRAHCPAGVSVGYARRQGYPLLDCRLYMPREWLAEEAYAARRRQCGGPVDLRFKTKPALGWEMIQAVPHTGTLRARWVSWDEALGRDTSLLDHLDGLGLWSVAEVPHDTQVWPRRPAPAVPAWAGQGRKPTRPRVLAGAGEPTEVAQLAASRPTHRWVRPTIKEGSKGPLVACVAARRVIAVRGGLPGPEVWLVVRRPLLPGAVKTYLSNAPSDTPVATLVRLRGMRWPMETCFEDGKQYLGMGDYEVRGGAGGHHHRTLCILAHGFLVRVCLKLKKSPGLDPLPGASAVMEYPAPARLRCRGSARPRGVLAAAEPRGLSFPSQAPHSAAR